MLKVGLVLQNRGILFGWTTVPEMLNLSEKADQSGSFSAVLAGDCIMSKPRLESITLLAAIAARTDRVRLGTACMASFALRHPVVLAYQWASLDVISGGRTTLIACLGGSDVSGGGDTETELKTMGVQRKERVGRLVEGIQILRRLWTEDKVSHAGQYYRFENAYIEPKPVQKPCPPIWIASNPHLETSDAEVFARSMRRVAKWADGWMTFATTPERLERNWKQIQQLAREERDPGPQACSLYCNVNINSDRSKACEETRKFLAENYVSVLSDEKLERYAIFGPAKDVASRLREFAQAGADSVAIRFSSFNQLEQVERCINELVPLL